MPPYPWPGTGITLAAVDFPVLMVPARSAISPSSLQGHIGALVSAARKPPGCALAGLLQIVWLRLARCRIPLSAGPRPGPRSLHGDPGSLFLEPPSGLRTAWPTPPHRRAWTVDGPLHCSGASRALLSPPAVLNLTQTHTRGFHRRCLLHQPWMAEGRILGTRCRAGRPLCSAVSLPLLLVWMYGLHLGYIVASHALPSLAFPLASSPPSSFLFSFTLSKYLFSFLVSKSFVSFGPHVS